MKYSEQLKETIVAHFFNPYSFEDVDALQGALKDEKYRQNNHDNFEDDKYYNDMIKELQAMKDYLEFQSETANL